MTLRDIHESVAGLGHPEYPLLDPLYSPSTAMPVVDFSPTVRDLILEDDWNTIYGFLAELSHNTHAADATVRKFKELQLADYLIGSEATLAELVAILLLTHRIPHSGHASSNYWLLTSFFKNTVACADVRFTESAKPTLLKRLSEDIAKQRSETERDDLRSPSISDLDELDTPVPRGEIAQRLAAIPVTSRTVVFDALIRNWGHSSFRSFRPELYYGERQFGNNTEWNIRYVEWTKIFVVPPLDTDLTKLLSKEAIRAEADRHGVSIPKSYSRSRMLERVRDCGSEAYTALFLQATMDSAIVDPSLERQVEEVLQRRERIEYACRAIAAI